MWFSRAKLQNIEDRLDNKIQRVRDRHDARSDAWEGEMHDLMTGITELRKELAGIKDYIGSLSKGLEADTLTEQAKDAYARITAMETWAERIEKHLQITTVTVDYQHGFMDRALVQEALKDVT